MNEPAVEQRIHWISIFLFFCAFILLITGIGICLYYLSTPYEKGYVLSYTFTEALACFFFIFLLLKLIDKPFLNIKGVRFLFFAIIFSSLSARHIIKTNKENYLAKNCIKEVNHLIHCNLGALSLDSLPNKYFSKEYGNFASFLNLWKDWILFANRETTILYELIEESSIDQRLEKENLSDYFSILETIIKLQRLRNLLERIEYKYNEFINNVTNCFESVGFKKINGIEYFISTFKEGQEKSDLLFKGSFIVLKEFFLAMENLLSFMVEKNGSYTFQDDQLIFTEDKDVEIYNDYVQKIQELGDQYEKTLKQIEEIRERTLQNM